MSPVGRKAREDQGNLGRRNKGEGCQQGQKELRKKAVGLAVRVDFHSRENHVYGVAGVTYYGM